MLKTTFSMPIHNLMGGGGGLKISDLLLGVFGKNMTPCYKKGGGWEGQKLRDIINGRPIIFL